jgi:transcriptional regulator with XRE-family HTH domain
MAQGIIITMDFMKDRARKSFADRLKLAIQRSGLKQYKLAEMIGVEPPNVSRWVKGVTYPSEEHFSKLCEILSVDAEYFETGSLLNESLNKSDLMVRLYSIVPSLNEDQLGQLLRLAEVYLEGESATSSLVDEKSRNKA